MSLRYADLKKLIKSVDACPCRLSLRKRYPYSELFWSLFARIWTEHGEILRISPYSVQMRENLGKMRTRITPNTDSFYPVDDAYKLRNNLVSSLEESLLLCFSTFSRAKRLYHFFVFCLISNFETVDSMP